MNKKRTPARIDARLPRAASYKASHDLSLQGTGKACGTGLLSAGKKGSPANWTPAPSTQVVVALLVTGTIRPSASA